MKYFIGGENELCARFNLTKAPNITEKKKTVLNIVATNKVKRRNSGLDKQ